MPVPLNLLAAKAINRVLGDYPLALAMLRPYVSRRIDTELSTGVSPLVTISLRVTNAGLVEPVGEGGSPSEGDTTGVRFRVPVNALPALARKDEAAFKQLAFEGDSEFAHTLSTIARNVEWDVEADLSKLLGDSPTAQAVAHQVSSQARTTRAHLADAGERVMANLGEYLLYESNAFVSRDELKDFAHQLDELRDGIARAEARFAHLSPP